MNSSRLPVLFIHSAGPQGRNEGSSFLLRYLVHQLGDRFDVSSPAMPEPDAPHYHTWKSTLETYLSKHERTVLVGHSLGGSVILKYLAEATPATSVLGLFLVASPYWSSQGWDVEEFLVPESARFPGIGPVFLYHSEDDEVVPVEHMRLYAGQLPSATLRPCNHRGHLFSKGLPELITDIKNLPI